MAPDADEQRFSCPFGVTGGPKLLPFQPIKRAIRGEKTESASVACNDSGGPMMNFDDVGLGHGCSFAGMPTLLSKK
jgi:hypothetical protein